MRCMTLFTHDWRRTRPRKQKSGWRRRIFFSRDAASRHRQIKQHWSGFSRFSSSPQTEPFYSRTQDQSDQPTGWLTAAAAELCRHASTVTQNSTKQWRQKRKFKNKNMKRWAWRRPLVVLTQYFFSSNVSHNLMRGIWLVKKVFGIF